jgi:hypothetical protein
VETIILIAALAAIGWSALRGPAAGFAQVYLPALLLAPTSYALKLNQLPELTFDRAAALGVALVALITQPLTWRLTVLDFALACFVAGSVASEYLNTGYTPAQSLLFSMICTVILPYALAKRFLGDPQRAGPFARVMLLLLAVIAVISVLEFRLGLNIFRNGWGLLFPGQADKYIFVQYRWGYGRIAGPFEHAIFCGMAMGIGTIVQSWMSSTGNWRDHLWVRRSWWITLILLCGLLMTMSRGPWLAAAIGLALASVPRMLRDWRLTLRWIAMLGVLTVVVYVIGFRYSSEKPLATAAEDHLSVSYRANLYAQYKPIIEARMLWGYGTITWPKAHGMRSVDNEYLQMALSYGMAGLVPFALLLALSAIRLLRLGITQGSADPTPWMLLGVVACFAVNLLSVFLGNQLWPLLFLLLGWGEAVLCAVPAEERVTMLRPETVVRRFAPVV